MNSAGDRSTHDIRDRKPVQASDPIFAAASAPPVQTRFIQHIDRIADLGKILPVVRNADDRAAERPECFPDSRAGKRTEIARRLVKQQHVRPAEHHVEIQQLRPLAAGERGDLPGHFLVRKAHTAEPASAFRGHTAHRDAR